MRKIPSKYENPLDDVLISIADQVCPAFKKLGFTPHGITTLSLICGLFALVFILKGYLVLFALFYLLSYFFDCLDGHYARKYNMVTTIGDLYDHIKDIVIAVLALCIMYIRNKHIFSKSVVIAVVLIFVIFSVLGYIHLGCQEKYYQLHDKKTESCTLSFGKQLCPGNPEKNLKFTRWFGMGTWVIITILFVIITELYARKT